MNKQLCDYPYLEKAVSLTEAFSKSRLLPYQKITGDTSDAFRLYCWNSEMSKAFYHALHAFEIVLANAMSEPLLRAHGPNWYEKISSYSSSNREKLSEEEIHVEKAKNRISKSGGALNHDGIVSSVSFGFWTGLIKNEYKDALWTPHFSYFIHLDREEAFNKIYHIKDLRNAIAHYDPIIIDAKDKTKARELFKDYKLILKLVRWIHPDSSLWIEYHSSQNFFNVWNSCPDCWKVQKLTTSNLSSNSASHWQFK